MPRCSNEQIEPDDFHSEKTRGSKAIHVGSTSNTGWYNIFQGTLATLSVICFANRYAPNDIGLFYNDYNDGSGETGCYCVLPGRPKGYKGSTY